MSLDRFGGKPFTRAAAEAAGVTPWVLRTLARPIVSGVYVANSVEVTPLLQVEAAILRVPGAVASHHTAIRLWKAIAPDGDDIHLSVLRDPRRGRTRVRGVQVHEVRQLEHESREGVPRTPPGRCFLDLAQVVTDVNDLVIAGDSLIRQTRLTPASLGDIVATPGGRGIVRARDAAALVRDGVDSPMETRLRLLLLAAGLPDPVVGYTVRSVDGGWIAKPDLAYPFQRIAIDYDGRHHLDDPKQWRRDIARREDLEREGWLLRVVIASDIYRSAPALLGRILDDLHQRNHPAAPRYADLSNLPAFARIPRPTRLAG